MVEGILDVCFPISKDDKLGFSLQEMAEDLCHQIEAFLPGQAGYDPNQDDIFILGQAELGLKGQFIGFFILNRA